MDPFVIPRFIGLAVSAVVRRFGWKLVLLGWALAGALAVVLQQTI